MRKQDNRKPRANDKTIDSQRYQIMDLTEKKLMITIRDVFSKMKDNRQIFSRQLEAIF